MEHFQKIHDNKRKDNMGIPKIPEKFETTEWMKQQFGSAKLANELRSGNYINYMGKPTQCTIQTIYAISKIEGETAMYMPIPLTEEWFLKFRFKKDDWYKYKCVYTLHDLSFYSEEEGIWYCGHDEITIEIKSVHQLQNLYFALTGKELTLSVT